MYYSSICTSDHIDDKSRVWHARIGYFNYISMELMSQVTIVHGKPRVTLHEGVCKSCMLGKHQREKKMRKPRLGG